MEPFSKSVTNYFNGLRYNPLSAGSDKKQKFLHHALSATTGPLSTNGRLYFNRPLPGQNSTVPFQKYNNIANSLLELSGPNGTSLTNNRHRDINLEASGFAEQMHDYNLLQDWSDSNMIKKGIVPCEILLRREKIANDLSTDLIESNHFISLTEGLADRLGDNAQSCNIAANGFYGQYAPLSRLMFLDDSLHEAYLSFYSHTTEEVLGDLCAYISPVASILHQNPVENFISTFDVIGAYIGDDIQKDPSVVCETVHYVSRGSIHLAKESHLLNLNTTLLSGNLAIPSACFVDLDLEEDDVSSGDAFYTYLLIFSENSRLRIRVVKSKNTEIFVTNKMRDIYCSSKNYKRDIISNGISQLFNSNKYLANVAIHMACKRLGMSTIGAINDDDYVLVNNIIGIKRFYLDIGNQWYKI